MKDKKILAVIAIAVVAFIAAGALLISYLTPQRTTIYVFKDNYKAGTTITSSMLTSAQVDSKIVIAGSSVAAETYYITANNIGSTVKAGDVLRTDVYKGTAFMTSHISSIGSNEIEIRMASNAIAVTIPVTPITGITNSLKAESHVNVYVTYSAGGTYLLLENMRILSVASSDGSINGVTLELDNEQAAILVNAANTGSLYLGLVNSDGYIYVVPETEPAETEVADEAA